MFTKDDDQAADEVEVHKNCGGLVRSIGEDGISFCESCEHVVEGETEFIPNDGNEIRPSMGMKHK